MRFLPLSRGHKAIVDDEDFERLSNYKWSLQKPHFKSGIAYAHRTSTSKNGAKRKTILLHREVLGKIPSGKVVDHIDFDTLNCQKSNLRLVSRQESNVHRRMQKNNTSGYIGVYFDNEARKWRAQVKYKGKYATLRFKDKEDAAIAYNAMAQFLNGPLAILNPV